MDRKGLSYLLPIRCIVFILTFLSASLITGKNLINISCIWSVAVSIINILTIILLIYVSKKRKSDYKTLICFEKGTTRISEVILISLLVIIVGMGGMFLAGIIIYSSFMPAVSVLMIQPINKILALINIFILPVSTTLAEDGLYLGCGVNGIQDRSLCIIIPAFFYALQHSFMPMLFDARYILYRFISFIPCVLLLCIIYKRKKNPLPIMVGHALLDVATVMQIAATSLIPGFYESMSSMV